VRCGFVYTMEVVAVVVGRRVRSGPGRASASRGCRSNAPKPGARLSRGNQRHVKGEAARSSQKIDRDGDRVGREESAKGRRRERNDESARRVSVFWERWR
jgi:hypothetical protein